ncbi:MAG: sugar ABC transporter permease [Actinomycetota bacterium]|nr:sugar ABC transporter permease [Actinomycetota bacterium]|tara:strand:+ start:340 stop:1575 length:1236 start_codon:yes stop_codon:yes gene_type:complete
MRETTQQEKLMSIGISMLALGIFPLIWFLSQAILFRELTDAISRNLLVVVALIIGSTFIFLLFLGMDKIIKFAPKENRDAIEARMFVGPSLFMIALFLFYPALRTIYISFKDRYSNEFIGIENYRWAFTDPEMIVTIRNQIIWLIFVVTFVLLIGLVVGWLSDRLNKGEAFFKSIVFLPMAISAVGASAIFKFIYEYRPPPLTQIGIINGIRVSVDRLGTQCMNNRIIDGVFNGFDSDNCLKPIGWLQQRDMSNLPFAQALDTNNWFNNIIVNLPVNTMLLMLIMIWMFTGFAAVVFSAGIKAIPQEIMEAGQIDGASELRVFRSIVIPYIKSTIIVVGTYMVVTVLKAFDIIYVSTRGDLETNLLAVKMLDEFSKYRNFGRSATVAVLIFVCVLPIIIGTAIREKENTQS